MQDHSSPAVHDVRPFVGSQNYDLSRDFYIALGWEVAYDSDDLRFMRLGEHNFYLQNYYQKQWCENTMLHVSVPDVDKWFAFVTKTFSTNRLHEHGRISGEPERESYGRVFHVWDPAGALIHFAQFAD